jgi:curved DNA-binding protein CbpA
MPGWRHGGAPRIRRAQPRSCGPNRLRKPAFAERDRAAALMYPRQFTHLDGHNAYDVLGIGTRATRADIESARRRLAGQVHPDLPTGDAARMSLVNAAAAILLDDAQRNAYDAYLATVSPVRRSTPRPVDRTPSSTRDQHRDQLRDPSRDAREPQRDSTRDPHGDLNRGLFGDPSAVRDRSTRLGTRPGERSTQPPSPGPFGRRGARDRPEIDDDRDRRPRPTRGPTVGPTMGPKSGPARAPARRDDDRTAEAGGSEPRDAGQAQRRRPSPGPSHARTGRIGLSTVPPWEDEQYDGRRPALRWQPPPPGPIARWRANRRQARLRARGARRRRLKAGSPIPVLGLFVMIVAVCAIGGAALGYRTAGGSSPSPTKAPSAPATSPAHPRPSPTAHHK